MRKITLSLVCMLCVLIGMAQTGVGIERVVQDAPGMAKTILNQRSVKLNENFNGEFPPAKWKLVDNDGDGHGFKQKADFGLNGIGDFAIFSESYVNGEGAKKPDNYLISPKITIENNDALYFWARNANKSYPEKFYIVVSEKTDAPADFVKVDSMALTGSSWTRKIVDLSAYAGKDVYVGIWHRSDVDKFYFLLDEMVVMTAAPIYTGSLLANAQTVLIGDTYSGTTAYIANLGSPGLKISKVTDLTGTAFSTNLDIASVNLGTMSQITFNVSYSPTKVGKDSVAYVIEHNGVSKKDTIWFYGTGEEVPANTLQIGNGFTTKKGVPSNVAAAYAYSQTIYKKEELTALKGKRIEKVYYHANGFPTASQNIWTVLKMGYTDQTSLTGWLPQSDYKMVFRGNVKVGATQGWVEIVLDEPFYYDDTKNLVIAYFDAQNHKGDANAFFYAHDVSENMTAFVGNGSYINTDNPPGINLVTYRPNIRFGYNDYPGKGELRFDPKSTSFAMLKSGVDTASQIVWFKNTGDKDLKIASYKSTDNFSLNLSTELVIKSGEQVSRTLSFHPVVPAMFNENIEFTHDGTGLTTFNVKASSYHPDALYETFDGADFPPVLWERKGKSWMRAVPPTGGFNTKYRVTAGNTAATNPIDTLITPLVYLNKGDSLNITLAGFMTTAPVYVLYSPDKVNWTALDTVIGEAMLNFLPKTVKINDSLGINYIALAAKPTVYIDEVFGLRKVIPEAEMFVKSFNGPRIATLKADNIYTVEVFNGSNFPTNEYKVEFFADSVKIGETAGTTVLPFKTTLVNFALNTDTIFNGRIHAYINFPEDTDTTNNFAPYIDVKMVKEMNYGDHVAFNDLAESNEIPFSLNYSYSLSQSLYTANLFQLGGTITHIGYAGKFVSDEIKDVDVKIWITETTKTDLKSAWIPATQMTKVFEGKVNCAKGNSTINIALNIPYKYNGGNVVVMIERPDNGKFFSSDDKFLVSTTNAANKTRKYVSDDKANDPNNPTQGNLSNELPAAIFVYDIAETGMLYGSISDNNENLLDGTSVLVQNTYYNMLSKEGEYGFNFVNAGKYTVSASKFGYFSADSLVTIEAGKETQLNIELQARYTAQVSGTIVDKLTNKPVANAVINFAGYNSYADSTDLNGKFIVEGVYESINYYKYRVMARGYYSFIDSVLVSKNDVNLDTIRLNEFATPAFAVEAKFNSQNQGEVKWMSPAGKTLDKYILDNGMIAGSIGAPTGQNAILGNKFETKDKGYIINVEVFGIAKTGAVQDTLYMLILNEKMEILGSAPFYMPANKMVNIPIKPTAFEGNFYAMIYYKDVPQISNNPAFTTNADFAYVINGSSYEKLAPLVGLKSVTFIIRPSVIVDFNARENTLPLSINSIEGIKEYNVENLQSIVTGDGMPKRNERAFANFDVYRLTAGDNNMANWTKVADKSSETSLVDAQLTDASYGFYQYAVVANYTLNAATPSVSNALSVLPNPSAIALTIDSATFKHTLSWNVNNTSATKYEVYLNDVKVDETTNKTYVFKNDDLEHGKSYKAGVRSIYPNGNSEIVSINFTAYTVGMDDVEAVQFNMFPVPASSVVFIEAQEKISRISIVNIAGEVLLTSNVNAMGVQLDINKFESGVYFVKVESNDKQTVKKLIIE